VEGKKAFTILDKKRSLKSLAGFFGLMDVLDGHIIEFRSNSYNIQAFQPP
jgi:hypothetical protein